MPSCRALKIAAYAVSLSALASTAALAQWPAAQGQPQPAPAAAWPAPQQQQAPASGWPAAPQEQAPAAGAAPVAEPPSAPTAAPSGAWPAPSAAAPAQPPAFIPPSGFGMASPRQQQEPPCYKDFMALRTDTDKKGRAIQEASKKKVPPNVACRLFNDFAASESKMLKFVSSNAEKCSMPKELLDNLKQGHAKTNEIRARVCEVAAAGPPRPAGPSLSDVLSAPVPDSSNTRRGRGTFDTLSGSPLQR